MLYKNFVFILAQLWFAFETLWSPTAYYNDFLMSCFNLFFTTYPPFIFGFWEQDLPQEVLLENPQLYPVERDPMSPLYLFLRIGLGVWQSACSYFGIRLLLPRGSIAENGTLSYLAVVIIVLLQVVLWQNAINAWSFGLYVLQLVVILGLVTFYIFTVNWDLMPLVYHGLATPTVLIGWIVAVAIALVPGVFVEWVAEHFQPTQIELVQEHLRKRSTGLRDQRSEPTTDLAVGHTPLYTS
jgi:magnesium-transporting ATPase (P-type)